MMVDAFPKLVEAIYVQEVQDILKTYKYDPEAWAAKLVKPYFYKTYTQAALHAATRKPPLLRVSGLRRICENTISDFYMIPLKDWPSQQHKWDRHDEINQSLCYCNEFLECSGENKVPLLEAERLWKNGEKVKSPYGRGEILSFDPIFNIYEIELDWRPIDAQRKEYTETELEHMQAASSSSNSSSVKNNDGRSKVLETVFEGEEELSETNSDINSTHGVLRTVGDPGGEHVTLSGDETTNDSLRTLSSIPNEDLDDSSCQGKCKVIAKIQCRYISKYTPPALPSFPIEDDSKSSFSFWGSRSESSKPKSLFNKDDKCSTPYGCGTVVEYRENTGIVVLSMSGWSATSYLNAESVKIVSEGFFNRMFRNLISTETSKTQQKSPSEKETSVPYAVDSLVCTPFGEGRVVRPLESSIVDAVPSTIVSSSIQKKNIVESDEHLYKPSTIAISLSSWVLSDNTSPVLYCTIETAQSWKAMDEEEERSKSSGGILSAFGSIVSQSVKKLIVGKSKKKTVAVPSIITVPMFERFYFDGAAVVTIFGNGVVTAFRESDGMYVVKLQTWKMANGRHAKLYAMKETLNHQIAKGCIEGYPVLTSLGLSGTLLSVQPRTSIHVVAVPTAGMVCYFQPKDVLRPLKASVKDDVVTLYGNGKLVNFRAKDDVYEIELGWGAKLYASAESFDRDNSGDDESGSGFEWVFKLFFSDNSVKLGSQQRSRSNSIASARTNTSRSVL